MLDHRGCVFLSLIIVITGPVTGPAGFMPGAGGQFESPQITEAGCGCQVGGVRSSSGVFFLLSVMFEFRIFNYKHKTCVDPRRGLSLFTQI